MQFDIMAVLDVVRDVGVTGVVLFALIGGWKKFYVWHWYYDERVNDLIKQRDDWRDLALGRLRERNETSS